jgi:hypothetical protein
MEVRMHKVAVLATLIGVTAISLAGETPAWAQKIAPSRNYGSGAADSYAAPPSTLEKNYGLPSFGQEGADLPKQKTMAPEVKTPKPTDFFAGGTDFKLPLPSRNPGAAAGALPSQTTDVPADSDAATPDFFADGPKFNLPKTSQDGSDTPTYTTGD